MKLKYTFEAVDMGDEIIFVPVGDKASEVHGVLKLNAEGKEVVEALKEETTEEKIVQMLAQKYNNDPTELTQYVRNVIDILKKENLLEM